MEERLHTIPWSGRSWNMLQPYGILTIKASPARLRKSNDAETCKFDRRASISAMLETLGWRTIEQRRTPFLSFIRLLITWSQGPSLIISKQTRDHSGAAILPCVNCTRQMTTITMSTFSLWQLRSRMRSKKMLLGRQAFDIFKAAVGKLQHSKPRSQVRGLSQ